jgi:predicted nucleic acid-binding protein
VILTDTGPLIALLNRNDPDSDTCKAALDTLPAEPLLTTWPCFTEAMYLLRRMGGFPFQRELWFMVETGRLVLHAADEPELLRMSQFMAKYRDLPMDLADESLIAAGESLGLRRILTLDGHFRAYRFADGSPVEVVP